MNNKIGLKKAVFASLIIIIVISILFEIVAIFQYKSYTRNFNQKFETIISNIMDKYPNVNINEIMDILNKENNSKTEIFKNYGINLKDDSILIKNDKLFIRFSIINLCFISCLAIIVLIIFMKYNKQKDKKLQEITKYIEEINNKNYKLDIEDNSEDELSILKNEIYKTTVMLNEVAENSTKDKTNLKDSLSDISHQLKTPLTSISVLLDNIIENPQMDNKTRNEFIKDIKREITNINFLVSSLLKLSKLDVNSVKFVNKDVFVADIIDDVIKNVSVLCDLKNIEIKVKGNTNIKLNCDFKWQVEALTNILKNCVEHSNENSNINIMVEKNNVYTKIEIKDYGNGIDKDDLPHIFERFYKGKNASNESVGIGLALAKSIIENNNGYISVDSKIGVGSTFIIKYFKN